MSWTKTFNGSNSLSNTLSKGMNGIELNSNITEGEIQAKIAKMSISNGAKGSPNSEKDTDTYTPSNNIEQGQNIETYNPHAPVINMTNKEIMGAQYCSEAMYPQNCGQSETQNNGIVPMGQAPNPMWHNLQCPIAQQYASYQAQTQYAQTQDYNSKYMANRQIPPQIQGIGQ